MIKDIAVTTWSHTSYSDIWPMYYGQFEKNAPFLKHYMFINEANNHSPHSCTQIVNDETKKFSERLCYSLEKVEENTIIWMQEDFVLYDPVESDKIVFLNDFLNNSDYSFIRLIKSGVEGGSCIDKNIGLYEVPILSPYLYCLQATIWKKLDLYKLYDCYRPKNMMDSELYGSNAARSLGMKGCYVYNGENKRGNLHYDSSVFPYISTALYGGSQGRPAKWQLSLYPKKLGKLLKQYNIDKSKRGTL